MSRFAIEWAKQQRLGDSAAKAVLLLLADRAGGRDHECYYSIDRLAFEACLPMADVGHIVTRLREGEWLAEGPPGQYRLLIPPRWSTPTTKRPKRNSPDADKPTAVYRLYDPYDKLLYVGITENPARRLDEHRSNKSWWQYVATREIVWCDSRRLAEAEECRAIAFEMPKYNISDATSNAQTRGRSPEFADH